MNQLVLRTHARFAHLLAVSAGAWIVFAGPVHAQTDAAPTTIAPNVKADGSQPTTPSPTQATDISQIAGAEITKTGNVITGINIKDCKLLTPADYKLIRQTETLKSLSFAHGPDDASLNILAGMPAVEAFSTNGTAITDAGLATLATFKTLQTLTFFHPGGGMTGTGLAALATLPNLNNLTVAGSLAFADPGMAAVGQLTHLKAFRTWHSGVSTEGVKSLGSLKELNSLMIGQRLANKPPSTTNDDTIAVLATFSSLQFLNLGEARLSLSALRKLSQIPDLKMLTLAEIDIPESDIVTLKQLLPKTQIKWTAPSPGSQKRIDGIFGPAVAASTPGTPAPAPAKN